uniref:Uncharacterized protein n=1 Tax=Arundo donax TaxID=35708 RepID=A0A0A9CNW9_ARUDO
MEWMLVLQLGRQEQHPMVRVMVAWVPMDVRRMTGIRTWIAPLLLQMLLLKMETTGNLKGRRS